MVLKRTRRVPQLELLCGMEEVRVRSKLGLIGAPAVTLGAWLDESRVLVITLDPTMVANPGGSLIHGRIELTCPLTLSSDLRAKAVKTYLTLTPSLPDFFVS